MLSTVLLNVGLSVISLNKANKPPTTKASGPPFRTSFASNLIGLSINPSPLVNGAKAKLKALPAAVIPVAAPRPFIPALPAPNILEPPPFSLLFSKFFLLARASSRLCSLASFN